MSIATVEISVPGSVPSSVEIEGGFGPDVVEINQGPTGPTGATGPAGPNTVSTTTATNITGLLKGNGSTVLAATAGTDYLTPTGNGSGLTGLLSAQITDRSSDGLNTDQGKVVAYGAGGMITTTGQIASISTEGVDAPIWAKDSYVAGLQLKIFTGVAEVTTLSHNATELRAIAFPDASGTLALTTSNVATATALATARNIGGTSFNGSANIEIPRARATSSAGGTLENQSSVTCFSWGAGGGQNITIPAGTGVGLNATSYTFGTGAAAALNTALGLTTLATTTPGTGIATFLATPTSANLAAAVTGETGSGSLVFATSPTISNPTASTSSSSTPALIASGPTSGIDTIQIRGTNNSSYSSIGFMDTSNAQKGSFGFAGTTAGSYANTIFLNSTGGVPLTLGTAATERMRISTAGGVSIGTTTDSGTSNLLVAGTITTSSSLNLPKTITAAGTTGARTINQPTGSVNFAAGATSLVVTNSLVSTSSVIMVTMASNDATAAGLRVVAGAGSFTIHLMTAPTAEMRVNFLVTN